MPGETALLNVIIKSQSDRLITKIEIQLVQKITVRLKKSTKKSRTIVEKLYLDDCQVRPGGQEYFSNLKLKIPTTCPSLVETCPIIQLYYFIQLKADVNGPSPIYIEIPIEIGTVPLMEENMADVSSIQNFSYVKKSRGENNDGKININESIDFYDPLYPVYTDLLSYGSGGAFKQTENEKT